MGGLMHLTQWTERQRNFRIHLDVLWIFRRKARIRGVGYAGHEAEIIHEMPQDAFEVDKMFFGKGQYQPHALFGGKVYVGGKDMHRYDKVVASGRLLAKGYKSCAVARMVGVDDQTVRTLRRTITEYTGQPFKCACGREGGHPGSGVEKRCIPEIQA